MILTFVFVERNTVTIAVKLKKMCVNVNKGRGYVVVNGQKWGTCTVNMKTTYDVTERWHYIFYLCVRYLGKWTTSEDRNRLIM